MKIDLYVRINDILFIVVSDNNKKGSYDIIKFYGWFLESGIEIFIPSHFGGKGKCVVNITVLGNCETHNLYELYAQQILFRSGS